MSTTKKKIISLEVRDEFILGSGVVIGAQGSFNSVVLEVKFDKNWNDLPNKYITWTDALGNDGVQQLITAFDHLVPGKVDVYQIPVPQFATNYAGTVKLSFSGFTLGGENSARTVEVLANTASGAFRVLESNATVIDEEAIKPTQAQELSDQINAYKYDVDTALGNFEDRIDVVESNEKTRQTAEFGEGCRYDEAQGCVVDENNNPVDNSKAGRVGAELDRVKAEKERQEAEFGADGYKWNDEGTAIIDKDGIPVANIYAGRVGAELDRQIAETARNAAENGQYDEEGNLLSAGRVQNETDRINNETDRITNETDRITNEEQRRIHEYGETGVKYDPAQNCVLDAYNNPVDNSVAGRVGAELERQKGYKEMKSLIGNIDSALDSIIAMQNSLIGGNA